MAGEEDFNGFGDDKRPVVVPPAVEVALENGPEQSKTPWPLIAGVGALIFALGAGAIAISSSGSELDTAQQDLTEQTEDDSGDDDADAPDIQTLTDEA